MNLLAILACKEPVPYPKLTEDQYTVLQDAMEHHYDLRIMDMIAEHADTTMTFGLNHEPGYQSYREMIETAYNLYKDFEVNQEIYQLPEEDLERIGGSWKRWNDTDYVYLHNHENLQDIFDHTSPIIFLQSQHSTALHECVHALGEGHEPEFSAKSDEFILTGLTPYEKLQVIHEYQDAAYEVSLGLYWLSQTLHRNSLNPEVREDAYPNFSNYIVSENCSEQIERNRYLIQDHLDFFQISNEGYNLIVHEICN